MTTALVTGANKGIGLEIVKQLLDKGVTVYLGARDPERGEKAAADTGARFVQIDVTDPESVRRAAASLDQPRRARQQRRCHRWWAGAGAG